MIPFETALRAKLPFIGVQTDDPVHVKTVLQALAGKPVQQLAAPTKGGQFTAGVLYWTESLDMVTADLYRKLQASEATAICINLDKPSMLVFDVGVLPTPDSFYRTLLADFVTKENIPALIHVLRGTSLKAAQEAVSLTMARTGNVLPHEVRKTRQMLGGEHPGLSTLETDFDFYEWPKDLRQWLDLNDGYFLNPTTPAPLVPRGLLLAGDPGVGKSMAARVLAKHWDVPLFRLDVSTSLNRYLGESEGRIARNLSIIEQNAPCVWLLDEAEKLFGTQGDEGTTRRILSQILWWLQAHKARVLTVMTTNDLASLPKELYRAERLDRVITIGKLSLSESKSFAAKVYAAVMGHDAPAKRFKVLRDMLDRGDKGAYAHAEVRVMVYDAIKIHGWLNAESLHLVGK